MRLPSLVWISVCLVGCAWSEADPQALGRPGVASVAPSSPTPPAAPSSPTPPASPATPVDCGAVTGPPGSNLVADQGVFGAPTALAGVTLGPTPSLVHLGWPARDTSTSISMVWVTDPGTLASRVEWGAGEALDQHATGASFTVGDAAPYRVHELRLCGALKPSTTYRYRDRKSVV